MKKSRHTESEMVKAVKELESGVSADLVAREYAISRATLYGWKSKYSGMDVRRVKKLKELEEENRKLKQMYADLALDYQILQEVIEKNSRARGKKRTSNRNSRGTLNKHLSGVRNYCEIIELHRSVYYYKEKPRDDSEVEAAIREAGAYGEGFWKIFHIIRKQYTWNHKKVYRVYKKMHYEKRSKLKKRLPARVKNPLIMPTEPNTTWSIDFVSDSLECGRKFRVLNIIDDSNRIAIAQEVSMSMPAHRVISFLEKAMWIKGKPKNIRCDNGPEFISHEFQDWCKGNEINILYTQPGCPTQNSYIERFNGSYRRSVLDAYVFRTLGDVRERTDVWQEYYNNKRPHEALNNMTPQECKEKVQHGA